MVVGELWEHLGDCVMATRLLLLEPAARQEHPPDVQVTVLVVP